MEMFYQLQKTQVIRQMASLLKVNLDEIIESYPEEEFNGRLNRKFVKDIIYSPWQSDEFEEAMNRVCNLPFLKDKRTPVEYGIDLICGWLMEDVAIAFLKSRGLSPEKNGSDAGRVFLKDYQITTNSDLIIAGRHFDVYFDSKNIWHNTGSMDIRESKWNSLRAVNGIVLCFSVEGIAIVRTEHEENLGVWENPWWGFKRAVSVGNMKSRLLPPEFAISLLESILKS